MLDVIIIRKAGVIHPSTKFGWMVDFFDALDMKFSALNEKFRKANRELKLLAASGEAPEGFSFQFESCQIDEPDFHKVLCAS